MDTKEHKAYLKEFKAYSKEVTATKESAKKFLFEAGIHTKTGRLKIKYAASAFKKAD